MPLIRIITRENKFYIRSIGLKGSDGVGVPSGGETNQVLAKASDNDFDTEWVVPSGGGAVTSVNSKTGAVVIDKADVGLGNVDNTSDANKPISSATQTALNTKEDSFSKGNIVAGLNVTLDGTLTNRLVGSGNITINASAAGGQVDSITGGTGIDIDNTDPTAPEVALDSASIASLALADSAIQGLTDLGLTATATELNYVDGVTSAIQTQLNAKENVAKLTPIEVSVATAAGTAAKVGTTTGGSYSPTAGDILSVTFSNANTANNPTLNIDSSGAVSILLGNLNPTAVGLAGTKVMMWYDGTAYQLFGSQRNSDANTTYAEITTAEIDAGTASTLRSISGRRSQYILDKAVQLTGDQSVDGVKTFTSSPVVPEPTTDLQAATKKYVDDNSGLQAVVDDPSPELGGDLQIPDETKLLFLGDAEDSYIKHDSANFADGELIFHTENTGNQFVFNFTHGFSLYSNTEEDGSGDTYAPYIVSFNENLELMGGDDGITLKTYAGTDADVIVDPDGTGKLLIQYLNPEQLIATTVNMELVSLDTSTYPSLTEMTYLKGVTSGIQTQLGAKAADSDVVKLTGNQSVAGEKIFSGRMGIGNVTASAQLGIRTGANDRVGLTVRANGLLQTADLQQWQTHDGTVRARITSANDLDINFAGGKVLFGQFFGLPFMGLWNAAADAQAQLYSFTASLGAALGAPGPGFGFGPGGDDGPDVTIYRSAVSTLRTNANLVVDKYTQSQTYRASVATLSTGSNASVDFKEQELFTLTLQGNITVTLTDGVASTTQRATLKVVQDGAGSRIITWAGNVKFPGGIAPVISAGANNQDILEFIWDGTHWNLTNFVASLS